VPKLVPIWRRCGIYGGFTVTDIMIPAVDCADVYEACLRGGDGFAGEAGMGV